MNKYVDPSYFKQLLECSPEEVCKRALCQYEKDSKKYFLHVWGNRYAISPETCMIEPIQECAYQPHEFFYLFIIYYLLNVKNIEIFEKWISEKEMPGGTTFFRGPHTIPTSLITEAYKNNVNLFKRTCEQLGGTNINQADAAFVFQITPKMPIAVLYWEGDDDFPPEAKILFDQSIIQHLKLDIIFSLAVEICTRIAKNI
jgi:hypothetical protein